MAVVTHRPASDCAAVVEAVSAVHGAVDVLGQVLKDLDDGVDDGAEDDGDVSISRITVNISQVLLSNVTNAKRRHLSCSCYIPATELPAVMGSLAPTVPGHRPPDSHRPPGASKATQPRPPATGRRPGQRPSQNKSIPCRILLSAFVLVHWRGARRMLATALAMAARAAWVPARTFPPNVLRSLWRARAPEDAQALLPGALDFRCRLREAPLPCSSLHSIYVASLQK